MKTMIINNRFGSADAVITGKKDKIRGAFNGNLQEAYQKYLDKCQSQEYIGLSMEDWLFLLMNDTYTVGDVVMINDSGAKVKITDVSIERTQDITDDEILKGVIRYIPDIDKYYFEDIQKEEGFYFSTAREAYAHFADLFHGEGTWKSNNYMAVYNVKRVN